MATMWRWLGVGALAVGSVVMVSGRSAAQTPSVADGVAYAPAYTVRHEGEVQLRRDGRVEPVEEGLPLDQGDRLTTRYGRLEWRRDGAEGIFLDRYSDVEILGDDFVRLVSGVVVITLPREGALSSYRVDTADASVRLTLPGRYRIAVVREGSAGSTEVTATRGRAFVRTDLASMTVEAGERVRVTAGLAPELPIEVNVALLDAFDRWVEQSPLDGPTTGEPDVLPPQLSDYGPVLSRYGSWRIDASYGAVWYPRTLPGWRPYLTGRWHHSPHLGWVWMGTDPWSWPTHHYGRWQTTPRGQWFWIPLAGWAGAHVQWAVAPGYVGWSPLGWDGQPVVGFSLGLDRYDAFGRFDARGAYGGHRVDPWSVWTVVPAGAFGHRSLAKRVQLDRGHFARTGAPAFVMTGRLPTVRGRVSDAPGAGRRVQPRRERGGGRYDAPRAARPRSAPRAATPGAPQEPLRPRGSIARPREFDPVGRPNPFSAPLERSRRLDTNNARRRTGEPARLSRPEAVLRPPADPARSLPLPRRAQGSAAEQEGWRPAGASRQLLPSAPTRSFERRAGTPPPMDAPAPTVRQRWRTAPPPGASASGSGAQPRHAPSTPDAPQGGRAAPRHPPASSQRE